MQIQTSVEDDPMELRKIQETKGGTFFVTLPKDWALNIGITKGSVVSTSVGSNGRLVVDPRYNLEPTPRTATVRPSPYLSREIIGKYLLGYDIIRVEAKDRITMDQRRIVKEATRRLVGLEIVEEDQVNIVVRCFVPPSAFPPEGTLRYEHSLASSMLRDAVISMIEGDTQLARQVVARDNEVDRQYFLLVRILRTIIQNPSLSEKLGLHPIDCLDYRLTASLVESVADQSSQIGEHTVRLEGTRLDGDIARSLSDLNKVAYESYTDALAAFFSRNISMAESVREKREVVEEMERNLESACSTLSMNIAQTLTSVVSIIQRIYDYSVDISDLTTPRVR